MPPRLTPDQIKALSPADLLAYALYHSSTPATTPAKRPSPPPTSTPHTNPAKKKQRQFDISRYGQRLIALRLCYTGWLFHGFASQLDNQNTVETHLFNALLRTRLIQSRHTCQYSRAGRTDVGVSALGQVVGLRVRSNVVPPSSAESELDYVKVLNGNLPRGIRVLAWMPVAGADGDKNFPTVYPGDPACVREYWQRVRKERGTQPVEVRRPGEPFSARFDAVCRTYKYFFVGGGLDVLAMAEAAVYFEGRHDFRNFCRIDDKVKNFERVMNRVQIRRVKDDAAVGEGGEEQATEHTMFYLYVNGQAFLWHQVRCMAAVLFDVGLKREQPAVVKQLLDDAKSGEGAFGHGRPQYRMASPIPLLLYDCAYPESVVGFPRGDKDGGRRGQCGNQDGEGPPTTFQRADRDIAEMYAEEVTKASVLEAMLNHNDALGAGTAQPYEKISAPDPAMISNIVRRQGSYLLDLNKGKHVPYHLRSRDESVEAKFERLAEKSRTRKKSD